MVLLIPDAWRKAKREERRRIRTILAEHAKRDPDMGALTISPAGLRLISEPDEAKKRPRITWSDESPLPWRRHDR